MKPVLYLVVPCYNEELVLSISSGLLLTQLTDMVEKELIHPDSRILFVDDGSKDGTWSIIKDLARENSTFLGIRQSRNRGHQNALLAGLMEVKDRCDITISIDCDGQDDVQAMTAMIQEYLNGCQVVYGVRSKRDTDSGLKRITATGYYRLLRWMGVDVVFNHSDYRLISREALEALSEFEEVNLYLRGMVPLVGFKCCCVPYERRKRLAGKSKYTLKHMVALAAEGITSLSVRPIRMIAGLGFLTTLMGLAGMVISAWQGDSLLGWLICFMGGVQLVSTGVIGEYVGKIYQEVKRRPRYIISERTQDKT